MILKECRRKETVEGWRLGVDKSLEENKKGGNRDLSKQLYTVLRAKNAC